MVAPQVFQGKKLDVMVPESSRHLDRFFGASFISSKASLNILPGNTNAKYWSQQIAFTKMQENSVARTRRSPAKVPMIPVTSTIPPKHIAHKMMEMVQNIPCMPSQDNRLASSLITSDASSGTEPMETPLFKMLKIFPSRVLWMPSSFSPKDASIYGLFQNMRGIPMNTPPSRQ